MSCGRSPQATAAVRAVRAGDERLRLNPEPLGQPCGRAEHAHDPLIARHGHEGDRFAPGERDPGSYAPPRATRPHSSMARRSRASTVPAMQGGQVPEMRAVSDLDAGDE